MNGRKQDWEWYVRDAADRKRTLIITGSNARMLSWEVGTKLTGRHLDFEVYRRILQYLLSNTGKEVSINNIKNTFDMGSASSVMDLMGYLSEAYLMFPVPKYDTSFKVQARNPRKIYGIDQGLVHFSSLPGSPDLGRLLENTVFLKMKREGNGFWYYRGKRECDFVCRDASGQLQAIQVTSQISSRNDKRETEGLLEAMDRLSLPEGTIITFDQEDLLRKDGKIIHLIPDWKWMG